MQIVDISVNPWHALKRVRVERTVDSHCKYLGKDKVLDPDSTVGMESVSHLKMTTAVLSNRQDKDKKIKIKVCFFIPAGVSEI